MDSMVAPTLTAVLLMLALGVRHGLDPEHIAIVNSVTMRAAEDGRRQPALSGLYFALGHGLVITAVAMGLTGLLGLGRLPAWVAAIAAWLPTLILFLVATLNLVDLLRPGAHYQPSNVKARFLPGVLRDSAHPLAVFVIGMLFAPFVDPATQTAVWAYVIGSSGSGIEVAALGGLLTLSMAVTCVLEARGMLLLAHGADQQRAEHRRRVLGWCIVVFSYAVVGYSIGSHLLPHLALQWLIACIFVAGLAMLSAALTFNHRRHRRAVEYSKIVGSEQKPPQSEGLYGGRVYRVDHRES